MQVFKASDQVLEKVSHDPRLYKSVIVGAGVLDGVPQIATITLSPGERTSAHAHADMDEFFYVVEGAVEVLVDECREVLTSGEAILISTGERHVLGNRTGDDVTILYFGVIQTA